MNNIYYVLERWGACDAQAYDTLEKAEQAAREKTRHGKNMIVAKVVVFMSPAVSEERVA